MSYNGYCLYSTFKTPSIPIHPAVKAVVPINTTSRLSTMSYRDGPLHLELIIRWSGYLWSLTRDTTSLIKLVRACRAVGRGPGPGPGRGPRQWPFSQTRNRRIESTDATPRFLTTEH
jgi:hypothetical protein